MPWPHVLARGCIPGACLSESGQQGCLSWVAGAPVYRTQSTRPGLRQQQSGTNVNAALYRRHQSPSARGYGRALLIEFGHLQRLADRAVPVPRTCLVTTRKHRSRLCFFKLIGGPSWCLVPRALLFNLPDRHTSAPGSCYFLYSALRPAGGSRDHPVLELRYVCGSGAGPS